MVPENIIEELGLTGLSEEDRAKALDEIGKVLYQAIMVRVVPMLSDADAEEFDALLDTKSQDPNEVFNYLRSKISDFDAIVAEEVEKFKAHSRSVMEGGQA